MPDKYQVNPELVNMIDTLLKDASKTNSKLTLDEKLSIVDRALKIEQIRARIKDDGYGSGFDDE